MLAWLKSKVVPTLASKAEPRETVLERVKFHIRTGLMAGSGGKHDRGI